MDEGRKGYAILDGDQKPTSPIPSSKDLSARDLDGIGSLIHEAFKVKPLHISGSDHDAARKYVDWVNERVLYLDAICPEMVMLEALIGADAARAAATTNQEAKAELVKELKRRNKPTHAEALCVAASYVIAADDVHIEHLANLLRGIMRKESK